MTLRYEILPVTPFRQNCTLIWDDESGEAVLTDVGGDVPFLLQALANRKLTLTAIWLTHGHLDHAGGVVEMLETHKVPVLGPHRAIRIPRLARLCAEPLARRRRNAHGRTLCLPSAAYSGAHARTRGFLLCRSGAADCGRRAVLRNHRQDRFSARQPRRLNQQYPQQIIRLPRNRASCRRTRAYDFHRTRKTAQSVFLTDFPKSSDGIICTDAV